MKITLFAVSILLLLSGTEQNQNKKDDVVCSIELAVVKSKKFGQLISVIGKIKNRTSKKLYFDRMRYLRIDILKQEGGKLIDFFESWHSYEMMDKDRDEMMAELKEVGPTTRVFNQSTGEFTDSLAKAFYNERVNDPMYVKSAKDRNELMNWTRFEFEQIVFLQPQENSSDINGMNSLPPGSYKIVYSYSNVSNPQIKKRLPNLTLPKILNGYERWTGTVVSDTLYLNVR